VHLRAVLTSAADLPLGLIIVWRLYGECDEISPPLERNTLADEAVERRLLAVHPEHLPGAGTPAQPWAPVGASIPAVHPEHFVTLLPLGIIVVFNLNPAVKKAIISAWGGNSRPAMDPRRCVPCLAADGTHLRWGVGGHRQAKGGVPPAAPESAALARAAPSRTRWPRLCLAMGGDVNLKTALYIFPR
jgi:hypothetical protein